RRRPLREDRRRGAGCNLREVEAELRKSNYCKIQNAKCKVQNDYAFALCILHSVFCTLLFPNHGLVEIFSPVGKSSGTGSVTLPVAAHSVPRASVVRKPTHLIASRSWPIVVWKTRPFS